jgi:hypothetical protein
MEKFERRVLEIFFEVSHAKGGSPLGNEKRELFNPVLLRTGCYWEALLHDFITFPS